MRPKQKDTMQTEPNNFSEPPPLERAAALRMLLADRLAGDLASFVKKAWTIIHPSRPLIWSWHYDLLCECQLQIKGRLGWIIVHAFFTKLARSPARRSASNMRRAAARSSGGSSEKLFGSACIACLVI